MNGSGRTARNYQRQLQVTKSERAPIRLVTTVLRRTNSEPCTAQRRGDKEKEGQIQGRRLLPVGIWPFFLLLPFCAHFLRATIVHGSIDETDTGLSSPGTDRRWVTELHRGGARVTFESRRGQKKTQLSFWLGCAHGYKSFLRRTNLLPLDLVTSRRAQCRAPTLPSHVVAVVFSFLSDSAPRKRPQSRAVRRSRTTLDPDALNVEAKPLHSTHQVQRADTRDPSVTSAASISKRFLLKTESRSVGALMPRLPGQGTSLARDSVLTRRAHLFSILSCTLSDRCSHKRLAVGACLAHRYR